MASNGEIIVTSGLSLLNESGNTLASVDNHYLFTPNLSATTISGNSIYSGGTDLSFLFGAGGGSGGTGFNITSSNSGDSGQIGWWILEPSA